MARVLLCALMEDGNRFFFLARASGEKVYYGLPCVLAGEGEDPVQALSAAVSRQAGVDVHVTTVAFSGKHNSGSRRRNQYVAALAFHASSKSYKTGVAFKWMTLSQAFACRLERNSEWLRDAVRA